MLHYLYYKLYRANRVGLLSDIAGIAASMQIAALLGTNIMQVNALLAKLDLVPFLFRSKSQVGLFIVMVMALLILYFRGERHDLIVKKYIQEDPSDRKKGNVIVWIYVGLTFISIFVIAFYKPGKL